MKIKNMKNNFILTESEKKRILGLHNKYINKPQTWVIKETFTGTAGDGYDGDVAACKKDLPYNVAVKTGQIKSSAEWKTLRQAWGSDGSMTQNLKMRDEMCDGWRSGDKLPEEESSDSDTSDQQKKLEYQKRKEPFTKIPNYAEGEVVTRNYGAEVIQDYPNHEILKYIPSGDSLAWYTNKNLVSYRDDKKEDLKLYLENGNIISKTPSNIKPKVWKYLGKWNY
jgi:hypothetical protein